MLYITIDFFITGPFDRYLFLNFALYAALFRHWIMYRVQAFYSVHVGMKPMKYRSSCVYNVAPWINVGLMYIYIYIYNNVFFLNRSKSRLLCHICDRSSPYKAVAITIEKMWMRRRMRSDMVIRCLRKSLKSAANESRVVPYTCRRDIVTHRMRGKYIPLGIESVFHFCG